MVVEIILGILTLASIFATYYFKIKADVEKAAAGAINHAESSDKIGAEKMKEAIAEINKIVPAFLKPIFSDELLQILIQAAFDQMKNFAEKQAGKKKISGGTDGT